MIACEQAPGLNLLQHGQSVHAQYRQIQRDFEQGQLDCKELQTLYARFERELPDTESLERYHIYHDCGKHLCATQTAEGKRQFPNHAEVSAHQYGILFPEDVRTKQLISLDMAFHTLRGEELLRLCADPLAPILYFTAWAEVNANAVMFGGRSSESYKIKRSRLIQAGKKLLSVKGDAPA
jgi:hypothetical protein